MKEQVFQVLNIQCYAGKEAKTGLLGCVLQKQHGSSENTLDHTEHGKWTTGRMVRIAASGSGSML